VLWPMILPPKITLWLFAGVVALATVSAPVFKAKRTKALLISTIISVVAFIPSCATIKAMGNARRFRVFDIPTTDRISGEHALPAG